jgi:hypothetical protein
MFKKWELKNKKLLFKRKKNIVKTEKKLGKNIYYTIFFFLMLKSPIYQP